MIPQYRQCSTVKEAMEHLTEVVEAQQAGDANYFFTQQARFEMSAGRIQQICPAPAKVLDIGSHYLHQAVMLSLLGYDVCGLDVPTFTDPLFVQERAKAMKMVNLASTGHQSGQFLEGQEGTFDIVVCTEILEHITFNPVAFWKRVWELLKVDGLIYLTTPNSFRVRALLKALVRLGKFDGIGLDISEVLSVVTYGHHWKEYSRREIRRYFNQLSPDFIVETTTYSDPDSNKQLLSRAFEILPPFRSNIEAVIRLNGKSKFLAPPVLPFMKNGG